MSRTTSFDYNAYTDSDLLEKIGDNEGNYIKYQYDTEGNRLKEEIYDKNNVLKQFTDYEPDDYNRLKKIIYHGGSCEEYTYDGNNNLMQSKDAENNITAYGYDANPVNLTDPYGLIDSLKTKILELVSRGEIADGFTAMVNKINRFHATLNSLIQKFPLSSDKCGSLAKGIFNAFKKMGGKPQYMRVGNQLPMTRVQIGEYNAAQHYVVKVGNMIYDAYTGVQGMTIEDYKSLWYHRYYKNTISQKRTAAIF